MSDAADCLLSGYLMIGCLTNCIDVRHVDSFQCWEAPRSKGAATLWIFSTALAVVEARHIFATAISIAARLWDFVAHGFEYSVIIYRSLTRTFYWHNLRIEKRFRDKFEKCPNATDIWMNLKAHKSRTNLLFVGQKRRDGSGVLSGFFVRFQSE